MDGWVEFGVVGESWVTRVVKKGGFGGEQRWLLVDGWMDGRMEVGVAEEGWEKRGQKDVASGCK